MLHSVDELVELTRSRAAASARLVVGIAGPPGAGKSTVAEQLVARLGGSGFGISAALLPMDGVHLPQARLVELGRRERMGAADTFDVGGFMRVLAMARTPGAAVVVPGFDRTIEEPVADAIRIPAETRVIAAEGNYLLHDEGGWQEVAPLLHLSVFLGVDRDIRLARLVARHERFGKSPADARAWALGTDEVNAELVEASAARADEVLRLAE